LAVIKPPEAVLGDSVTLVAGISTPATEVKRMTTAGSATAVAVGFALLAAEAG